MHEVGEWGTSEEREKSVCVCKKYKKAMIVRDMQVFSPPNHTFF